MAQSDFAEKTDAIISTDVMTGDKNRNRFLYYQLKMSMREANRIDMVVSFLMESFDQKGIGEPGGFAVL